MKPQKTLFYPIHYKPDDKVLYKRHHHVQGEDSLFLQN